MPNNGERPYRVLRGGSWLVDPSSSLVSNRSWDTRGYVYCSLGVRLSRILTPLLERAEMTNVK